MDLRCTHARRTGLTGGEVVAVGSGGRFAEGMEDGAPDVTGGLTSGGELAGGWRGG